MSKLYNTCNKQYPSPASWRLGCLLTLLILFSAFTTPAQTWVNFGAPGFSAGTAWFTSMAIDASGTPYVAYQDYGNGQKATVKKYNGTNWVTVGTAGFTGWIAYYISIAIDTGGTPYIAFEDYNNSYKASVMKFNGTSWVYVGTAGFSAATASNTSIAIDKNGTPYVAYEDYGNGKKATVMKYNGANWIAVGSPGFSDSTANYTRIALDTGGTPYVTYEDYYHGLKTTVMKYNGTSWAAVGTKGFSAGTASYNNIIIRADTPYVVYSDAGNSGKATAMKFNGTSWTNVGIPGFSAGVASYLSMAMDGSGAPYTAYFDGGNSGKATVMKYSGGAWAPVGSSGFSDSTATYTSIAINAGGLPYVAFSDYRDTQRASVWVLDIALAPITGTKTVCVGSTTTLSDVTTGGTWSSASPGIATVGSTGIVTGVATGMTRISYTVSGNSATAIVTVAPIPVAGSITGASVMCADSATRLTDATAGGTWSSSNTAIATVNGTGGVTGHLGGTVTISYTVTNSCGNDFAQHTMTLNPLPSPGTITGATSLCISSTTTLSDTASGIAWSSSNTAVATINSSGIVTGVATGTTTISYSVMNGCGTSFATKIVTVEASPVIGGITGPSTVCKGANITLSDGTNGGIWSSSNTAIATVSSTGTVTGQSGGTALISYAISNSCSTVYTSHAVTVGPLPDPGNITGGTSVCPSASITLSDVVTGGTWSSSNTAIATVGTTGIVTGHTLGTATISYTRTNSCGDSAATHVITVSSSADAGIITGADTVCASLTAVVSDAISGGVWSSSNTAIATIGSATGIITGHSGGTATISYTVSGSCGTASATHVIVVSPLPAPGNITGTDTICNSSSTTLTETISGGIWSSSNTSIATIDGTGIVSGISTGTATISYAITNSCGTVYATRKVDIDLLPAAGSITGTDTVCTSATIILKDTVAGGVWSSSNNSIATIDSAGKVSGVSAGTATISYTVTNNCGSAAATQLVIVRSCQSSNKSIGDLLIYPNPNKGKFTATLFTMLPDNVTITISDMLGRKMKEFYAVTNSNIDIQLNVPPGMYFITAVTGTETVSAKINVR